MRLDNANIKDGKKKQWKYREKWKTREKCLLALLVKLMKRHIHHAEGGKFTTKTPSAVTTEENATATAPGNKAAVERLK